MGEIKDKYIELAAQAWCEEETKDKIMDAELAKAFAGILQREVEDVSDSIRV